MKKILFVAPYSAKHGEGMVGSVCLSSLLNDKRAITTPIDSNISGKGLLRIVFNLLRLYAIICLNITSKFDILYLSFGRTYNTNIRDILTMLIVKLRNPGAEIIIHVHGSEMGSQKSFFQMFWYTKASKFCDKVIILCENHKNFTFGSFFPKYKILPNPCIIDEETHDTAQNTDSETVRLLFVSNPIAEKGLDTIIDWIQCVAPEAHYALNVVGWTVRDYERVYGAKLPAKLIQNGAVKFHGPLYGVEKRKLFRNSDVFLFPTRYQTEAQPLVLLEALQYNLQIVTSRIPMLEFFEQYENHLYWDDKSLIQKLKKKQYDTMSDRQRALFNSEHNLKLYKNRFTDVIFT